MSTRWALASMVLLAISAATAQDRAVDVECGGNASGWRNGSRVCEIRELVVPASGALSVDARTNGSIRVEGEDRRDVQVRARVEAWGRDEDEARRIASEVVVRTDGSLRAEGPNQAGRSGWSVSYDVRAPHATDLSLRTSNGGIAIADVRGDISLEALNGGISVDGVAGNVRGRTTNGGIDATLTGEKWDGSGLELRTTNGGVRLRVPEDYSARLETATVNGGVNVDFPISVQGRIGREMSTTLGKGGALVRVATTNGGVQVSRR